MIIVIAEAIAVTISMSITLYFTFKEDDFNDE